MIINIVFITDYSWESSVRGSTLVQVIWILKTATNRPTNQIGDFLSLIEYEFQGDRFLNDSNWNFIFLNYIQSEWIY